MIFDSIRKLRYGDPVIVVSGLPRSGTSMMMRMLTGGGITPFVDGERSADIDNPEGYFEFERVKNLEKDPDKSWVRGARGRALKVISFLLKHLPSDNAYRVLYMRRDFDEILRSQDKMLDRLGNRTNVDPEVVKEGYRNDLVGARLYARKQPNMDLIEVHYRQTIEDPRAAAHSVNDFLGGRLDVNAMVAAVDEKLYRNRA